MTDFIVNGRFKVIEKLGSGAQGKVYKVEDLNNNYKHKALKEVKVTSREDLEFVQREVNTLQKLDSPYIIKYLEYDHDAKNGFYYILTEIYEDGTLDQLITKSRGNKETLEYETILVWSLQLLRGIDYLHQNSIIHRDVKPQNIFLHRYNLVLGDLGLAKDASDISKRSMTQGIGTMSFMAPELFEEKTYNEKIDIWAFGCVMYEMIELKKAFDGTFFQITSAINSFQTENLKLDKVPELFKNVLNKSIVKVAEERWTAKELITYISDNMFKQKPVESDSHLLDIQQVVEAESELWDACAEEREHFDTLFYQLTSGQDYLSGDKAKDFFKKSELPDDELLKFWNLVDFNKDGQLDKKEFGIACYLIKKVITEGQNLPGSLPTSLFESDVTMRTATATSSRPRSTLDKQQKSFNILISGSFKVIKLYDLKTFKLLKQFEGHKKDISSLKIINENTLASGSHDTMIKIWNIETGDCVQTLENHQWSVTNLETFHSDEEQLLISGSHSEIKIWSTNSGKCLKTLIEYATGIQHLKLLNNDHLASGDSEGLIKIWNLTTKKCVNNIEAHKGILAAHSVKCLQRISDEIVASGSKDRKIKLWNFKTNKCVNTLEGVFQSHTATVRCLSLMSDDVLCSGSSDKTVKIWNLKTSKCLKTLKGHLDKVTCLQVFNVSLVSGSDDTTIKIWNIITGECISTIQNGNPVTCLQILTI